MFNDFIKKAVIGVVVAVATFGALVVLPGVSAGNEEEKPMISGCLQPTEAEIQKAQQELSPEDQRLIAAKIAEAEATSASLTSE